MGGLKEGGGGWMREETSLDSLKMGVKMDETNGILHSLDARGVCILLAQE
jgi:hypothetical protein